MNKAEVKKILKRRRKEGYATFETILNIYDDTEELPEDILDLVSQKIERKEMYFITNSEGVHFFHEAMKEAAQRYLKSSSNT